MPSFNKLFLSTLAHNHTTVWLKLWKRPIKYVWGMSEVRQLKTLVKVKKRPIHHPTLLSASLHKRHTNFYIVSIGPKRLQMCCLLSGACTRGCAWSHYSNDLQPINTLFWIIFYSTVLTVCLLLLIRIFYWVLSVTLGHLFNMNYWWRASLRFLFKGGDLILFHWIYVCLLFYWEAKKKKN